MNVSEVESKRIRNFRLSIVKEIPKFPNNRATKELLENKSLSSIFIDYINWACRYVPPRPRKVHVELTATADPRWKAQADAIGAFLQKVSTGEDITPHLSLEVHKHGFTPSAAQVGPEAKRWADKDFLLNVMGFHHFHLGMTTEAAGHAVRTDDMLFAAVTRNEFDVLAIIDHSVFKSTDPITKTMTTERERLWNLYMERSSQGIPPGSVFVTSMIMTSGHSFYYVQLADHYASIIRHFDHQLDHQSFIESIYVDAGKPVPKRPKLKWHQNNLDLGLYDESSNFFIILHKWPV